MTERFDPLTRRGCIPPPTLLELPGTGRISRLVREVDGGGLAEADGGGLAEGLVRLVDRVLVTGVLLVDLDRWFKDVDGGRLPLDLLETLVERSRSFVVTRLRLEERPRYNVAAGGSATFDTLRLRDRPRRDALDVLLCIGTEPGLSTDLPRDD